MSSHDAAVQVHGLLIAAFALLGAIFMARKAFSSADPADTSTYSDNAVKAAAIATVFWGAAVFLARNLIAWQLGLSAPNLDFSALDHHPAWYDAIGLLRTLDTAGVTLAFGGNALIAASFHTVQRAKRTRLSGRWLPWFVFWGWQLTLLMVASSYILGVMFPPKDHAGPEWYTSIWIAVVWTAYAAVYLGTMTTHRGRHLNEAHWFYQMASLICLAFIGWTTLLYTLNYLAFQFFGFAAVAGVREAMTRWWYSHYALRFVLNKGFLVVVAAGFLDIVFGLMLRQWGRGAQAAAGEARIQRG
jgi:cytochrome c oxidase cbb3-type subunit 1